MIKREAKSATILRHWLKANPSHTCAIEMKDTRGKDYLNFSEVKEEQLNYALAIQSDRGVLLRVEAVAEGMPDYIYLKAEDAMIAIKYPGLITIINVEDFIKEKESNKRKSLTYLRAIAIAREVIKLQHV